MDQDIINSIEEKLGHKFADKSLLTEALMHASAADNRLQSNERLEFLGDIVLGLVVCQSLFERFPHYLEGDLTKIKSRLVSRKTCAKIAAQLGLNEWLRVGPGMEHNAALNGSLAAGALEAIIAAIYLDAGLEKARKFILSLFGTLIDKADAEEHQENYKSLLQQYAQSQLAETVEYQLLDEKGPDHNKCFETAVVVGTRHFKSAWGTNKKDAQQQAAYNALVELGVLTPNSKQ